MATRSSKRTRPAHDEWGVYDPQQAGLAALYARLDTKDTKAAAPAPAIPLPAAKTEIPDAPPARPTLRDAK
jgi:hypothetical protein